MPIILADIAAPQYKRIQALINEGKYSSAQEFAALAISNQIALESATASLVEADNDALRIADGVSSDDLVFLQDGLQHREVPPRFISPGNPTSQPLWGQYYRLLPVKFTLRLVLRLMAAGDQTELNDIRTIISGIALNVGEALRRLEGVSTNRSTPSLAVGWPNYKRNAEVSKSRFAIQYVGRILGGKLTGLPSDLGFLSVAGKRQELRVSKPAIDFSVLENPVFDNRETAKAFSDEEVAFILEHFRHHLPGEFKHMREVASILKTHGRAPRDLDEGLRTFYSDCCQGSKWSDSRVSLMRSGVVGRMSEMGLLVVRRTGIHAEYTMSDSPFVRILYDASD